MNPLKQSQPPNITPVTTAVELKLEEGDEVIDGKLYRAYQFKPGNDRWKNKPSKSDHPTKLNLSIKDRKHFKAWMMTEGLEKVMNEMAALEGKDYITVFLALVPYAMPKIAAVEHKTGEETINLDKIQRTHTITIKDMRTGKSKVIRDE